VHGQDGISVLKEGIIGGCIGLRAAVRLDISVLGFIELFQSFDGQLFDGIGVLATGVISFLRITLSLFTRKNGLLCFINCFTRIIFRGN
jgi:hypothetical protein